mgnify:CR=1 FL=1
MYNNSKNLKNKNIFLIMTKYVAIILYNKNIK